MSECGNKDDVVSNQPHQPQQQVSITPPPTPHVATDVSCVTVKDEPECHFSASSSSSLDGSSSCGYGSQWYRTQPWSYCQPRTELIHERHWSAAVDDDPWQWSKGCPPVNELDVRRQCHQSCLGYW